MIFLSAVFVVLISKIAIIKGQSISISDDCIKSGQAVTLHCDTPDFTQTISFQNGGSGKGSCVPGLGCISTDYNNPTQTGNMTSMTISSYSSATDDGSWTCTYGTSTSAAISVAAKTLCEGEKAILGVSLACFILVVVGVPFLFCNNFIVCIGNCFRCCRCCYKSNRKFINCLLTPREHYCCCDKEESKCTKSCLCFCPLTCERPCWRLCKWTRYHPSEDEELTIKLFSEEEIKNLSPAAITWYHKGKTVKETDLCRIDNSKVTLKIQHVSSKNDNGFWTVLACNDNKSKYEIHGALVEIKGTRKEQEEERESQPSSSSTPRITPRHGKPGSMPHRIVFGLEPLPGIKHKGATGQDEGYPKINDTELQKINIDR